MGECSSPSRHRLFEKIQSNLKDWVDEMEFCFRFLIENPRKYQVQIIVPVSLLSHTYKHIL